MDWFHTTRHLRTDFDGEVWRDCVSPTGYEFYELLGFIEDIKDCLSPVEACELIDHLVLWDGAVGLTKVNPTLVGI